MNPGRGFQRVLTVLLLVGVILTLWLMWKPSDAEAASPQPEKIVIVQQSDSVQTIRVYTKQGRDATWCCRQVWRAGTEVKAKPKGS